MGANAWRKKILRVVNEEKYATPDRAGATPLSDLADEVSKLSSAPLEAIAAGDAIVSLIDKPVEDLGSQNLGDYWKGLSYLSQYLPIPDKSNLVSAFRLRLFGPNAVPDDLKPFLLNALIMTSDHLNPNELKKLQCVREQAPVAWLNAAVMSGLFPLARENAIALLINRAVDINALILALDSWERVWPLNLNFVGMVDEFRNATNADGAAKLTRWMNRRGHVQRTENPGRQSLISPEHLAELTSALSHWNGFSLGTHANV